MESRTPVPRGPRSARRASRSRQMRRGKYYDQPPFPFVPGYDLVGVVERSGNGGGPAVGPRVAALTKIGGWADRVLLDAADLVPVPPGVDPAEAETVVVNGITAWWMLQRARARGPDDRRARRGRRGRLDARPARPPRRHPRDRHRRHCPLHPRPARHPARPRPEAPRPADGLEAAAQREALYLRQPLGRTAAAARALPRAAAPRPRRCSRPPRRGRHHPQVARRFPLTDAAAALRYAEAGGITGKVILIPQDA